MLASGGFDHTVKLWAIADGQCLKSLTGHDNVVWAVDFHPDGKTLASASADYSIKLWDVDSGDCRTNTDWP